MIMPFALQKMWWVVEGLTSTGGSSVNGYRPCWLRALDGTGRVSRQLPMDSGASS